MTGPRIGSLFSGYGGLDLAVQAVYPDATVAWHVEFDDAPSRVLAHHWPDVPNLHDVTTVEWSTVEPVDILTGGFPCQDVSVAGRRAGMTDGTRSGLWSHMVRAIDVLRPGLVVIENVGGLYSARADSRVEPCDYHMGDADGGGHAVLLRALDSVLGTLATLGYDAEWTALRAADVGAPHGRLRVFITAHPAEDTSGGRGGGRATLALAGRERGSDTPTLGTDDRPHAPGRPARVTLFPTPSAMDGSGGRVSSELGGTRPSGAKRSITLATATAHLLPTPNAALATMGGGRDPEERRSGNHSITLKDAIEGGPNQSGSRGDLMLPSAVQPERFGPYADAIQRWEHVIGRPAPAPTEPGRNRPRLAAAFVEWMMGLPAGHVTATPGLTRNQQLKALGNGVVPQQGAAALRHLHAIRNGLGVAG